MSAGDAISQLFVQERVPPLFGGRGVVGQTSRAGFLGLKARPASRSMAQTRRVFHRRRSTRTRNYRLRSDSYANTDIRGALPLHFGDL